MNGQHQNQQHINRQPINGLLVALTVAIASIHQPAHAQNTNRVLAYTNTGYVSIPSSPKLQNPTEMTIEAWLYPLTGTLIAKSDGLNVFSDRSYEFGGNVGGGFFISFFLGSDVWAGCGSPNGSVSAGKWTHVAGTFNSSNGIICLYVNGILINSATNDYGGVIPLQGLSVRQSSQPLVFGYDTVVTGPITGLMDEVRVWSVARTAADIQQTMYQRLTGTEPNLEGYWNFDTGTAADGTTNHLDGTFVNGATTIADNISAPVQIAVASVAISFSTASPLTTYQVQYATNLPATNWINVGTPLPGDGAVQSVMDTVFGQPHKYYRVIFY
jgi:hypothetical protein